MAKKKPWRPTKYKPEFCDLVDKYLKKNKDEWYDFTSLESEKGYQKFERKLEVKLPTIDDFSTFINVARSTVFNWRDKHPDFSDSLEKILKEQKKRLLNNGLSGDYNSTIAKLVLSSNHGMKERSDVTSDDEAIVPDKETKEKVNQVIDEHLNPTTTS